MKKLRKKKSNKELIWGFVVLVLSFLLTLLFSYISEVFVADSSLIIGFIAMIVLLILNVSCDVLANAVLSAPVESYLSMASQKVRGAKRAVKMCKNAPKIASIFADVIGDICGIVSGSVAATLALAIYNNGFSASELFCSILISAIIGALTVGGKAFFKIVAVKKSKQIVFFVAKYSTYLVKE